MPVSTAGGRPQPGSAVLGAGGVLQDLCKGNLAPLCRDIDGNLRPVRMAPDAGAFQLETALLGARSLGQIRIGDTQATVERVYGKRSLAGDEGAAPRRVSASGRGHGRLPAPRRRRRRQLREAARSWP